MDATWSPPIQTRGGSHVEERVTVSTLGSLVPQHPRVPAMKLRPGNAGSNTFTGHEEVLAAPEAGPSGSGARSCPRRRRRRQPRPHRHLLGLSSRARPCCSPAAGRSCRRRGRHPALSADGGSPAPPRTQHRGGQDVAEIPPDDRAENCRGLRWIVRRVSRPPQMRNLTPTRRRPAAVLDTCTNIPARLERSTCKAGRCWPMFSQQRPAGACGFRAGRGLSGSGLNRAL